MSHVGCGHQLVGVWSECRMWAWPSTGRGVVSVLHVGRGHQLVGVWSVSHVGHGHQLVGVWSVSHVGHGHQLVGVWSECRMWGVAIN